MIGEGQGVDVEQAMAMIEKCQQLGGHFPDADALGRARRMVSRTKEASGGHRPAVAGSRTRA